MRFVRNEIQQPMHLVPPEQRNTAMYYLLVLGISILSIGVAGFFSAFFYAELIKAQWGMAYRQVQTYSLMVSAAGIALYVVAALFFEIPLRKTSFYKIRSILKNEPYDPPRKGDFTKAVYARLRDLDDKWALLSEVQPPDTDYVIPQVVIGPGGVYALHPIAENPTNKHFVDPGAELNRAGKNLQKALNHQVISMVILSTPKLATLYKDRFDPKVRVMNMREVFEHFNGRKNKLDEETRSELEAEIFGMIKDTAPER